MTALQGAVLGWDVGGANVKVARIEEGAPEPIVLERVLPLWREAHRLAAVLAEAADGVRGSGGIQDIQAMGVTMTAELADCFATKREGVASVLDAFLTAFPSIEPQVFGVDGLFHSVSDARQRPLDVAAANWMASARLVARAWPDALLLDVGSTTTDIIPVLAGRAAARGRTDPERLSSGELVYTGALRTPVCAIVRTVPLGNKRCPVAAEHFAVAADVHLWNGRITEADYMCETPDGRGRSRREAGARLARMVCADSEMLDEADVTAIAHHVATRQVRHIVAGIRQVRRSLGRSRPRLAVLAGQGAFLARAAAQAVGLECRDLAAELGADAARSVPAVAVAQLLSEMLRSSPAP